MQLSGEAVLISTLINLQDITAARSFGIRPEHFRGYKTEYTWLLNYDQTYSTAPSRDAFAVAFPDFAFSNHDDVRSACDMVHKSNGKERLTTAISEAMDLLSIGDLDLAYTTLADAKPIRAKPKPTPLLTDLSFMDHWDEPLTSIDTPYPIVNRHTGGMRPGNLWYLAARPGQGKSAHLVNIVARAVLQGCRVKFYSLEMSEMEVRGRFHALLATHYGYKGIDLNSIRDRTVDLLLYKEFIGELSDRLRGSGGALDIHTPVNGVTTPGVVEASAEDYHLNVVDYIGLMKSDGGSRSVDDWRVAAAISNDLKLVAGGSSSTILAAAQINREGDHGREPPKIRNLAQTDALAQDGDIVLTMRAAPHNVASIMSLEKNRHGPSGLRFHTLFDPNKGVYTEITADQVEDLVLAAEQEQS